MPLHQILKRSPEINRLCQLGIYGGNLRYKLSDLSRKGIQIGAHDLIIGSTALSLGFSVATYNLRHFERIEGLKIETLTLQQ